MVERHEIIATDRGWELLEKNPWLEGRVLRQKHPFLASLFAPSGSSGFVDKINLGTRKEPSFVAIKYLYKEIFRCKETLHICPISGIELFVAIHDLIDRGILCAEPLIATKLSLVSTWINGKKMRDFDKWDLNKTPESRQLELYLINATRIAGQLKKEGRWKKEWTVDLYAPNYLGFGPDNSGNYSFVAIDPVFCQKRVW